MTRSDRVDRLLRFMDGEHGKRLAKLVGTGRAAVKALAEEQQRDARTILLVALACVSDAELIELGLEPRPPRATRRDL